MDDDPFIRRLVSDCLQDEGLLVDSASNGAEALACVERAEYDLLVLDLAMPVMDGREVYRRLIHQGRRIPTLILSAQGASSAAQELGAEAGVEKPFDIDHLAEVVAELTAGSQAEDPASPDVI